MFCTNCGARLQDATAFCTDCGSRITPEPPVQAEPATDYYQGALAAETRGPTAESTETTEPAQFTEPPPPIQQPVSESQPLYQSQEQAPMAPQPSILSTSTNIVTLEPISRVYLDPPPQPDPHAGDSTARAIGRTLLSVLFAILAFAFICVFIALLIVRPGNIADIIVSTDVAWIMEETGLDEVILEQVNESVLSDLNIDVADIEEFLRRETVAAELSKLTEGYIQAIIDGDMGFYMSSRDISDILRAVAPDIRDQFDYRITDEDIDEIIQTIDDNIDLSELSVGRLMEDVNMDLSVPGALLSVYPLIVIGLLCALILFDIFLVHRKKVRNAFLTAGIPIFLAGLTFTAAVMILRNFFSLFGINVLSIISRLTGSIAWLILLHGLICLAGGAVFIIVSIVLRAIMASRPSKPAVAKKTKVWLLAGLATNTAVLAACVAISFLVYMNLI